MTHDNTAVAHSNGARCLDILLGSYGQYLTPDQSSISCPVDESESNKETENSTSDGEDDGNGEQKAWKCKHDVGQAHNQQVNPAPVVAGNGSEKDTDAYTHDNGKERNCNGDTAAVNDCLLYTSPSPRD